MDASPNGRSSTDLAVLKQERHQALEEIVNPTVTGVLALIRPDRHAGWRAARSNGTSEADGEDVHARRSYVVRGSCPGQGRIRVAETRANR